jgi:DNA polymerase III subunit gamma/tau
MSNLLKDIQGQEIALQFFHNYLKKPHTLPTLLILHGPNGVGKFSSTLRFVNQMICLHQNGCMKCESCKLFLMLQHPDYIEFPFDTKIAIGDEKDPEDFTIRWLLKNRLRYQPHLSKYRFIVLRDASLLNNEAETALLKTLEESKDHSKFIFLVDDLNKLKQTIISRGVLIPFQYIKRSKILELSETLNLPGHIYNGGSLSSLNVPKEVEDLISEKISGNLFDNLNLIKLEIWIRSYKEKHPEWEDNFDYNEFLECTTLLMIHEIYQSDLNNKYEILESIFEAKIAFHKKIAGLDNYILSKLFNRLINLIK